MTASCYTSWYGSSMEIKSNIRRQELHRQNQGSKFHKSCFSNRDNKIGLIQFRGERNPSIFKNEFSSADNLFLHQ